MTPKPRVYPNLFFREITLTQGQVALVDIEDFDYISQWKWTAAWNEHTSSFYAIRSLKLTRGRKGKNYTVRMHRVIMRLERFDPRKVDHREPSQTLDNRKENLRLATWAQNMHNRRMGKNNKTGYKGVFLVAATGLYGASVGLNGKNHHCGFHKHGEFARP